MIRAGLVSVTLRQKTPREVVELARDCGLDGIEWGGDIHVPHGDLERAAEVRELTTHAGLQVAAYGSYYRAGVSEAEGLAFERVLQTAVALGAPSIRVWAGNQGSAQIDEMQRELLIEDAKRIADMAKARGIVVAFEYHGHTLTDTPESTQRLLDATAPHGLKTLWQPLADESDDAIGQRTMSLKSVLPHLLNIHVYQWVRRPESITRLALARGRDEWSAYLELAATTGRDHWALLEFVRDDEPTNLLQDAQTLNEILASISLHSTSATQ